jgi:hypothetical protein
MSELKTLEELKITETKVAQKLQNLMIQAEIQIAEMKLQAEIVKLRQQDN